MWVRHLCLTHCFFCEANRLCLSAVENEPLSRPRPQLQFPRLPHWPREQNCNCLAHGFCIVAPPRTRQAPSKALRAFGLIYPSR
jgi:hypothetical protein